MAHAENGEAHISRQGVVRTVDCNGSTLMVMGTGNQVFAVGNCWAVTVQGSSNLVFYKNGAQIVWDRGRELGMTNQNNRVPA